MTLATGFGVDQVQGSRVVSRDVLQAVGDAGQIGEAPVSVLDRYPMVRDQRLMGSDPASGEGAGGQSLSSVMAEFRSCFRCIRPRPSGLGNWRSST